MAKTFDKAFPENENFNQYWYSKHTIEVCVQEIQSQQVSRVAFLSTPSLFFSLTDKDLQKRCVLFDFDNKFQRRAERCGEFVHFDFRQPAAIPSHVLHSFDMVVIDPPFITKEVWQQYATATSLLVPEKRGLVLASSVRENQQLLHELLQLTPVAFRPSIPHLVYQYDFFTNFEPAVLCDANAELADG